MKLGNIISEKKSKLINNQAEVQLIKRKRKVKSWGEYYDEFVLNIMIFTSSLFRFRVPYRYFYSQTHAFTRQLIKLSIKKTNVNQEFIIFLLLF
jgi:hypothetical protein